MKPPAQGTEDALPISLTVSGEALARFFPLLGEGILLRGPGGATVEAFLAEAAGIPAAYLRARAQTVFLNGRALDDLSTPRVEDGATLALSAAMPGLAGAVLRRGGVYASLRREISHAAKAPDGAAGEILVTLKLFNLIARELGPALLRQGILIPGARWCGFIRRQEKWAWADCLSAEVDGQPFALDRIAERCVGQPFIRLSLNASG